MSPRSLFFSATVATLSGYHHAPLRPTRTRPVVQFSSCTSAKASAGSAFAKAPKMASLSQHLVKMLSACHGSFLFRIFSLFPQLSLSLHRDHFSAHRLFSSLLRASLVYHFYSLSHRCTVPQKKKTVTDRLLVTYQPLHCILISLPPNPRRPFNSAEFDDKAFSTPAD